jgi:antiviral helicase SLH1
MLTVLRCISLYAAEAQARQEAGPGAARGVGQYGIRMNEFKIIYVAPMKALAAEIVRKFGKRLAYLGIKVRELTGEKQRCV